jgi:WD40 repeat protein
MNHQAPPAMKPASVRPRSRRGLFLAAVLLLLLLLLGGGFLAWRGGATHPEADRNTQTPGESTPDSRVICSDDSDPKYLEQLEFGPPIQTPFDRSLLDGLRPEAIPEIERYPWQPPELVAVLGEHRMRGSLVAASPDGKLLAIGSPGSVYVRIGPVSTIHEQSILVCPGGPHALAWSPNGATLAVSCGDRQVRCYDVRDLDKPIPAPPGPLRSSATTDALEDSGIKPLLRRSVVTLQPPTGLVTSLSYSGDGKHLLGGDNTPKQGVAWIWDTASRKVVRKLLHTGPVMSVAFSPVPGDKRALTAGGPEDGQLHLWDDALAGKEHLPAIDFRPTKYDTTVYVGQVGVATDGKTAFSAHPDAILRVWNLDRFVQGGEKHKLTGHIGVPVAAFSPDSKHIATGRTGDGVWLWSTETGKQVRRLAGSAAVYGIRFLGKGERLAFTGTLSSDANVHVHETATGKEYRPPIGHLTSLTCVALSPDGKRPASGAHDGSVRLWDLKKQQERHVLGAGGVWGVGFHPDAKRVFFYGASHATLPFYDADTAKPLIPGYDKPHNGAIYSAAVTRDGRYALTGGYNDGTVRFYRLSDGRQVRQFEPAPGQGPAKVALSPDMRRAIRTGGGRMALLLIRCQEIKREWPAAAWVEFLPDARAAFFGGAETNVWQVAGEEPKETEPIHLNLSGLSSGHLAADGKRFAAIRAGRIGVFEMKPPRPIWEWTPPSHFVVVAVSLSADGGYLLTANGDGTVYVIRLP